MAPPALALPHDVAGPAPMMAGPVVGGPPAPNECRPALLPPYVIGPTDVLRIESAMALMNAPVGGPHLVGPDGTVRVGVYGSAVVAGQTLDQARMTISELIFARTRQTKKDDFKLDPLAPKNIDDPSKLTLDDVYKYTSVDVYAYNSKQFFIIADGGGLGEQVVTLPITGNDYVLNAIGKINGLPLVSSKHHIWVARLNCPGCPETLLPVDWLDITKRGGGATNWQIKPGDRIYVQADAVRTFNNQLAKFLAPVNQLFGATLLGSQTINSIKSGGLTGVR
jgi:polysaccharide export outer membrane protein